MPRFTVEVLETWQNCMEVEAPTEEQAKKFVQSGCDPLEDSECEMVNMVEFHCTEREVTYINRNWVNRASETIYHDLFDDYSPEDLLGKERSEISADELAKKLEEEALSYLDANNSNMIISDWASGFIDKVDWREIAEHMLQYGKGR